jgi:hypothetical protein
MGKGMSASSFMQYSNTPVLQYSKLLQDDRLFDRMGFKIFQTV